MKHDAIECAGLALVWTIVLVLACIGVLLVYAVARQVGVL